MAAVSPICGPQALPGETVNPGKTWGMPQDFEVLARRRLG
jgi:hypothetical protein